jgi:4-hydroxy-3-polyprenylbenzoate decarboxylase
MVYAERLLELLPGPVELIMTEHGRQVAELELDGGVEALTSKADREFDNRDLASSLSSGSGPGRSMVVIPCSMNTLSKMASGIADNLVLRAASVCLKQDWRLVIVPRETPLSLIHIENMARLRRAGAVILPACPGFYHRPRSLEDVVDFVVGKVLVSLGYWEEASKVLKDWEGPDG